ncbi:ABC-2 type transport system permease protein [Elusimicrobium simillimum]|uniref:ABC transporter permease n=1 Tax=Elusimicrobium simillimum TaxID=3143438 RepID=UPI003C6F628E
MRKNIILGFFKKEYKQIKRDPKMIAAIFFVPVLQSVLFGLALTSEVKNIEFVVVGKPTRMTERVQTRAIASGWFKEVKHVDPYSVSNPADLLISRKAEAVLVVPKEGAEAAVEKGDKPFQLLVNATNAMRAQQVDGYIKSLLMEVVAEEYPQAAAAGPIRLDTRIMFNHYMSTPYFMIPAIMAMSGFVVLMVVCSMAVCKEKEMGTMEKLISSPATSLEITVGKTLPYFFMGLIIVAFIMIIGVTVFAVPFRGHLLQLIVTAVLFVASSLSVALLVSTIASNQQQAMMGCFMYLLPTILLSGTFFPVENIPAAVRWLCYVHPMTYSVTNFRNIMLKGGDMVNFMQYSGVLLFFAVTLSIIAYKNFKSKLN